MAERVVDELEVIEIDRQQRPCRSVVPRADQLELDFLSKAPPIEQTGQRVVIGEVGQLALPALLGLVG